jgi:hypothetical protein
MLTEKRKGTEDRERIELEGLKEFKEKIERKESTRLIEDYELKRESEEYVLKLYYEGDRERVRELVGVIESGRVCVIKPGVIEYIGGYDGIRRILHHLEKFKEIDEYILGMIYRDLEVESERVVYVREKDNGVEIYSEYELDRYLSLYRVVGSEKLLIESGAITKKELGRSIKYEVVIDSYYRRSFIKELSNRFYIQEMI